MKNDLMFSAQKALVPHVLKAGDTIRFVSPATSPDEKSVRARAKIFEGWGLNVEFSDHAFGQYGFFSGTDEERAGDFNAALNDPKVRAIVMTRGGHGAYRIINALDFEAVRRDPKFLVGFSDVSILHMALWQRCKLVGVHGILIGDGDGVIGDASMASLLGALMSTDEVVITSLAEEESSALTTRGCVSGILMGGNLELMATAAGWALPSFDRSILFLEAVGMGLGQIDRALTMLINSGCLDGVVGVAIGQFTNIEPRGGWSANDILRMHFEPMNVPILGGLPLGHESSALTMPMGTRAILDADAGVLTLASGAR